MAIASAPKARIARMVGTFLRPGISRQGREYTRDNIASAVETLNDRINASDTLPPEQRALIWGTHRAAEHISMDPNAADSSMLVARVTRAWQDAASGDGRFEADVPDTAVARDYASLAAHGYAPSLSVRFDWDGPVAKRWIDGRQVETAPRIITKGIDMTPKPGVIGAQVDEVHWEAAPRDVAGSIVETFGMTITASSTEPEALPLRFEAVDDVPMPCPECGVLSPGTTPSLNPDPRDEQPNESAPADAPKENAVSETAPAAPATEAAPATVITMSPDQFKALMTEAFAAGAKAIREDKTEAVSVGIPEGSEPAKTEAAADLKGMVRDVVLALVQEGEIQVARKGLVNTEAAGEVPGPPKNRNEAIAAVAERRTKQIEARRELGLPV